MDSFPVTYIDLNKDISSFGYNPRRGLGHYVPLGREDCELFVPCNVSLKS